MKEQEKEKKKFKKFVAGSSGLSNDGTIVLDGGGPWVYAEWRAAEEGGNNWADCQVSSF